MSDPREHYNEDVTRRRFLTGAAAAGMAAVAAGAPAAAQQKALDDPAVATEKVTSRAGIRPSTASSPGRRRRGATRESW